MPTFPEFPEKDEWRSLDDVLTSDRFAGLERLTLGQFFRASVDEPLTFGWEGEFGSARWSYVDDDEFDESMNKEDLNGNDEALDEWIDEVKELVPGMFARGLVSVWDREGRVVGI